MRLPDQLQLPFPRCLVGGFLALCAALGSALPATALAAPIVVAHRGGPIVSGAPTYPENSLSALTATSRFSRVPLEIDVRFTKDGVPVLLHDDALDRTTNCTGRLVSYTAAALASRCRLDRLGVSDRSPKTTATERVPTLRSVLDLARSSGSVLWIELKAGGTPTLLRVLQETAFPLTQVLVTSFSDGTLREAKRLAPAIPTVRWAGSSGSAGGPAAAKAVAASWVGLLGTLTPELLRESHRLGLRVYEGAGDPQEVKAAAELGVDAVGTDDPAVAVAALTPVDVAQQPSALVGGRFAVVRLACPIASLGDCRGRAGARLRLRDSKGRSRTRRLGDARAYSVAPGTVQELRFRVPARDRRRLGRARRGLVLATLSEYGGVRRLSSAVRAPG